MLPSICPPSACIENLKQINEILKEISLLKKYMTNFRFSCSYYVRLVSVHVIFKCFISIDRPEGKVVRGM